MSGKNETTHEVDARTNQLVQPLEFDVYSHDDYLRLREAFSRLPKIPTLLRPEEQPTATAPNRIYKLALNLGAEWRQHRIACVCARVAEHHRSRVPQQCRPGPLAA